MQQLDWHENVWIPGAHWKGFADGARVKGHELDRCVSSNVSPLFHLSQFRCPSRPRITGTFLGMAFFLVMVVVCLFCFQAFLRCT